VFYLPYAQLVSSIEYWGGCFLKIIFTTLYKFSALFMLCSRIIIIYKDESLIFLRCSFERKKLIAICLCRNMTWVWQVLKAIHFGDSALFHEHPELLDSIVRVYFHSSSQNYNRMECWGPLKDAMEVLKWTMVLE